MHRYRPLTVTGKENETRDSLRLTLALPSDGASDYAFRAGQHLPVAVEIDGKTLRRTYSLCSRPGADTLELGIRVQPDGAFSTYARDRLEVGATLDAMPPTGRFIVDIDPGRSRRVAAFAAGSGITPIIAILRAVLEGEPDSSVMLFYGNRSRESTMFVDDLWALKNLYPARLQLHFLFSREPQEQPIAAGRLDGDKAVELLRALAPDRLPDDTYLCGPDTMIDSITAALTGAGIDASSIHSERFGVPRRVAPAKAALQSGAVSVAVVMDGHERRFSMNDDGRSLVDAAADAGIELPFSCKGGVCATCRTHLKRGRVRMDVNYGLEPWEVEQGFILACQSHPESEELVLDYDRS